MSERKEKGRGGREGRGGGVELRGGGGAIRWWWAKDDRETEPRLQLLWEPRGWYDGIKPPSPMPEEPDSPVSTEKGRQPAPSPRRKSAAAEIAGHSRRRLTLLVSGSLGEEVQALAEAALRG